MGLLRTNRRQCEDLPGGKRLAAAQLVLLLGAAFAQTTPAPATTQTLSGTVVDATTNLPVFRALVKLTGQPAARAVLTDSSGHFTFPEVAPSEIMLTALKPGYVFTRDPNDPTQLHIKPEDAANRIQLRLYPEALLTGTITDPDGNPIRNIGVEALRATDDDLGRHWIFNRVTRSNAHGQFRLPVTAGEYRVQTDLSRALGTSAVMPTLQPDSGESGVHLQPGEQRDLDIHPALAPLLSVSARLNLPVDEIGGLTGILPDGTSFPVSFHATGASTFTAKLPSGSYILQARHRGFGNGSFGNGLGGEGLDQASLNLSPSVQQPIPLSLQFVPVASIPVEVLLDDAAVAAATANGQTLTPPNARTLSMALEPVTPQPSIDAEYLRTSYRRGDSGVTFTVPPGTYRLRAQRNYTWFITSALYGGTDVLAHELTVAAGSGETPLQVTVSNQFATLTGTVTLNGAPASCWIYLIATTPAATPVLTLRSGDDGTFTQTLPPGSYRALASASRHAPDPQALGQSAPNAATVTAAANEKSTIALEATPDSEAGP
jgi:hypothetical protein